jgi:hypothetical protein
MARYDNMKMGFGFVAQVCVTAGLVMDIKTEAEERLSTFVDERRGSFGIKALHRNR